METQSEYRLTVAENRVVLCLLFTLESNLIELHSRINLITSFDQIGKELKKRNFAIKMVLSHWFRDFFFVVSECAQRNDSHASPVNRLQSFAKCHDFNLSSNQLSDCH